MTVNHPTTITVNRDNWTGSTGKITITSGGVFSVEDVGLFRMVESVDEASAASGPGWDLLSWTVFSADGQFAADHALATCGVFRRDLGNEFVEMLDSSGLSRDAGPEGYSAEHRTFARQIAAARVLWMTV